MSPFGRADTTGDQGDSSREESVRPRDLGKANQRGSPLLRNGDGIRTPITYAICMTANNARADATDENVALLSKVRARYTMLVTKAKSENAPTCSAKPATKETNAAKISPAIMPLSLLVGVRHPASRPNSENLILQMKRPSKRTLTPFKRRLILHEKSILIPRTFGTLGTRRRMPICNFAQNLST